MQREHRTQRVAVGIDVTREHDPRRAGNRAMGARESLVDGEIPLRPAGHESSSASNPCDPA